MAFPVDISNVQTDLLGSAGKVSMIQLTVGTTNISGSREPIKNFTIPRSKLIERVTKLRIFSGEVYRFGGLETYGFFRKFFYPKSSLTLVYMGLRFFPLSFGGSCPNTRSISKRFIFLQGYLARGTFSCWTLTRNCYCLYHFLLANLSCHVFLQHFSACLRAAFHILQSFC